MRNTLFVSLVLCAGAGQVTFCADRIKEGVVWLKGVNTAAERPK